MLRIAALALGLIAVAPLAAAEPDVYAPLAAGQFTAAIERADRVLATRPDDVDARFVKAVALASDERRHDAIKLFEGLTRDLPDQPEPWNNLAVLYAKRGDWDRARDALEKALRTSHTYRVAHDNLGMVYATMAGQAYRKALALEGANAEAPKLELLETLTLPPPVVAAAAAAATTETPATPAEKPAPAAEKPAAKPDAPVDINADVKRAVEAWAAAWRGKRVDDYVAAYVPGYAPAGETHAAWAAQRRARIMAPKRIALTLNDVRVTPRGADAATASFVQDYRSDTFSGATRKTLELERRDGRWLIRAERTGR